MYDSDEFIKFHCRRCNTVIPYSQKKEDGYLKGAYVCERCWDRRPPAEDPIVPGPDLKPVRHPGYSLVSPDVTEQTGTPPTIDSDPPA